MAVLRTRTFRSARPVPQWARVAGAAVCAAVLLVGFAVSVQAALSREYQVKAVFLFNFAQFVEWPSPAFPEERTPLVIGVLGDDPFGPYLDEVVRGEKINARPLVIQRF